MPREKLLAAKAKTLDKGYTSVQVGGGVQRGWFSLCSQCASSSCTSPVCATVKMHQPNQPTKPYRARFKVFGLRGPALSSHVDQAKLSSDLCTVLCSAAHKILLHA